MKFIILPGFTMDKTHKDIIYLIQKFKQIYPLASYRVVNPPIRKITIYNNKRYRSWYDYYSDYVTKEECINVDHLQQSRKRLHKMLDSYKSLEDVYLVGYSQGCCVAFDAGLTYPKEIGGIIGFKGHIPSFTFHDIKGKQNIWVTHGKKDKTIGYDVAKQSYKRLKVKHFLTQNNSNHSIKSGINKQMQSLTKFMDFNLINLLKA